jgi:hypothetical protein
MVTVPLPVPAPLVTAGDFTAGVLDLGAGAPAGAVPAADGWAVEAGWFLEGPVAPALNGRWRLQVGLAPVGGEGTAAVAPAVHVDHRCGTRSGVHPAARVAFRARVDLPAGAPRSGGVHHCFAMLTYLTPAGTPGPFAAVVDLGLVRFVAPAARE